jgi:hypothetical protein
MKVTRDWCILLGLMYLKAFYLIRFLLDLYYAVYAPNDFSLPKILS